MMKQISIILALLAVWCSPLPAEPPVRVVASIKPLHALVAGILQDVAEPQLLIAGGASPHDYRLRPSDVRNINDAGVVFWIGDPLETVLAKSLAGARRSVALLEAPGLTLFPIREGGIWETHAHHDEASHGHAADRHDPHVWLDPHNAMAMVRHIGRVLREVDPAHAAGYARNTEALLQQLAELDRELAAALAPVAGVPYVVFHDGYQYFERRYGLNALGSIVVGPEQRPGARRVQAIRERIRSAGVRCVFSEPQFQAALVATLIEDSGAQQGILDPLGAELPAGPEAYFRLLREMADSLKTCLGRVPEDREIREQNNP